MPETTYYQRNTEKCKEQHKVWAQNHRALLNAYNQKYSDNDRQRYRGYCKKADAKRRLLALQHYSQSAYPKCVRCGIEDIRVLCLDHINNNGKEERKQTGNGSSFYQWLKTNDYPEGYQVLCWNCNHLKELERRQNGHRLS